MGKWNVRTELTSPAQRVDVLRTAAASEEALYGYLDRLTFEELPAETVESALSLILDHFGCAVMGLTMPWSKSLMTTLAATGQLSLAASTPPTFHDSAGLATIYGKFRGVPAPTAALVNGTAGHSFDLDDLYLPTMTHPGCIVVPAATAVADAVEASGQDYVAAVTAGYEMMCRVGRATGLAAGEQGFHPTGLHGPTGAAVAAAKLYGLDAQRLENAVGAAASFGGGIKAFAGCGPGMIKRLHAGRAAEAGVFAAALARSGFYGPRHALTGKYGLVPTLGFGGADLDALSSRLGEDFMVDDVYIKPFAACGALHGAIQAAISLSEHLQLPNAGVESVDVASSRRVLAQNSIPQPTDPMAAQYSAEYSVALALLGRVNDPASFLAAGTGTDIDVVGLAGRIGLTVDEDAERAYPDSNRARVTVKFSDGHVATARAVCDAVGSRGWKVATEKFVGATARLLSEATQQRLVRAVSDLAAGGTVRTCLEILQPDGNRP